MLLSGRAEIWLEAGVKIWDIAPQKILIEEAGGRFTALDLQRAGGAFPVAHPVHGKSALAKRRLQALRNHRVVLNEQHTHTAVGAFAYPGIVRV